MRKVAAMCADECIPMGAMLELTGRCNLACPHCYLDIRKPPRNELGTEEVFDVLRQLAEVGCLSVVLTGGEPFLRPDIVSIAREARRLGFVVRINTTGTLTTVADVRGLAGLGLASVELSVYAADAATHDAVVRRSGAFRKTLRTAIRLRRAGVRVYIKAPLTARVDARAVRELARRIGVEYRFDPLVIARRDGDGAAAAERASVEALSRALQDPELGLVRTDAPLTPRSRPCGVARLQCRIGPNGDVYPCSTYPTAVGNLREQAFREIWWGDSPLLKELRSIRVDSLGACGTCPSSGVCHRCIANAVIENGRHDGPVEAACNVARARGQRTNGDERGRPERMRLPLIAL